MTVSLVLSVVVWAAAFGSMLLGTLYALREFRKKSRRAEAVLPEVTVLKPVKGADSDFAENIQSFFELDYPAYELVFSVADPADAAVPHVEAMRARYPNVDCRLVVGSVDAGPNPKVNNLILPYEAAKYDVVLISDSNVRAPRDYLRRVVPHLAPDVGVVTAVIAGRGPHGVGGMLEATYLNSFYARWMHISSAVGHTFVVGKSMLFRKSAMERVGGLANFSRYIAEDYMAGQAMRRLGLKVVIMPEPIPQHLGRHSFADFWSRHLRWGRIRKAQAPLAFLVEPLLSSPVSGGIGAFAASALLGLPGWIFFLVHWATWFLADLTLMRRLEPGFTLRMLPGWFLRETLAVPLWLHMALGNSIVWRGNRLRILPGGLVAKSP